MDRNGDDCEAGEFDRYFDVDEMSEWLHKKANIPVELFCDILRSKQVYYSYFFIEYSYEFY